MVLMIATPPWFWTYVGTAVTAVVGLGVTAGCVCVHPAISITEKTTSKTRNSVEFFIESYLCIDNKVFVV